MYRRNKLSAKKRNLPRKMKRFRSQVITNWLNLNYEPCKVADIGGGKGLVTYLLNQYGWDSTVIDPLRQDLPLRYKTLDKKRMKIAPDIAVPRINEKFIKTTAKDFDLLFALHAHGCNMEIIDAAVEYNKDFMLLPCCVIDEPIVKSGGVNNLGINWRNSLVKYAESKGLTVKKIKFNFKGKNIAIYTDRFLKKKGIEIDPAILMQIVQDDVEPDPDDIYDYRSHVGELDGSSAV